MSDLISRQVLDLWNRYKPTIAVDAIEYDRELKKLLSTNLAEVGTDLISRAEAIDALTEYGNGRAVFISVGEAVIRIEQLPPIQPEIVRCKDCKHWIPYDWMFSEVWRSKNMADYPEDEIGCNWCDMAMKANDFCSRGEKREVTT